MSMSPHRIFAFAALLWIALGWPLARRRIGPNRWYGLRVPATFADRTVWYDANAITGRDMVALGVVLLAVTLLLPRILQLQDEIYAGISAAVLGFGSMLLAVRGWRLANRLLRERQETSGPHSDRDE
jgi:uncharacterized membrane protein